MDKPANDMQQISESVNDKLVPPTGWAIVEEDLEKPENKKEKEAEGKVIKNLPEATKLTERLVSDIERKSGIPIPEMYLRVDADTTFHVVLLVSQENFHAPKMAIAHILVDEYTNFQKDFDIHFTFSVQTEYARRAQLFENDYKLKFVNQHSR